MRCIPLFLFLLGNHFCRAQFSDSIRHYARFSATGNLNRSNNLSSYLLANEARYSIRSKRTTLNTATSWLYGEQESRLTNNDFTATADFNLYRDSSGLYCWALANFTASYSLKIRNQIQGGLGAAYNFLNTDQAWLNLSEGVLYETSRLTTGNPAVNRYHTFRNSLRLSYKFVIRKAITLNGANFLQQALGDGSDYIIRANNNLGVKLNKWITLGAAVSYNQFRRTGAETLLLTYGLTMEKYF